MDSNMDGLFEGILHPIEYIDTGKPLNAIIQRGM